ncbi:MAG: ribosomal protein S18-alanine N-acetyltransferase [Deltaproteobacteria bacterium]|nr:ribosomal protein S18-alanine N-acetyltransferase [Deltaproteobacteria bacterium]
MSLSRNQDLESPPNRLADIGLAIAPATEGDLDGVMEIEKASFRAPWKMEAFRAELANRYSRFTGVRIEGAGGPLAAFAIYWLVVDEVHIINFAVAPEWRRRGVGRALLAHIIRDGADSGCRLIGLEVRAGNEGAIALYRGFGFSPVSVRPKYYVDNDEDALVMMLELK